MSARCTIIVLAVGISSPDSTIAVETRMSYFPSQKADMRSSSSVEDNCPCATTNFASGTFLRRKAAASSRSSMRGQT